MGMLIYQVVGKAMYRPFPFAILPHARHRPERALPFVQIHAGFTLKLALATAGAVSARDQHICCQLLQREIAIFFGWERLAAGGAVFLNHSLARLANRMSVHALENRSTHDLEADRTLQHSPKRLLDGCCLVWLLSFPFYSVCCAVARRKDRLDMPDLAVVTIYICLPLVTTMISECFHKISFKARR